ncbi:MAG: amidohydrolase [Actinomycetota bacterium]
MHRTMTGGSRQILGNARVGTQSRLSTIIIEDRDIVAVLPSEDAPTATVDLGGRTVIPGIDDSHLHAYEHGRSLTALPLGDAPDLETLRNLLRAARPESSGWYRGQGWLPSVRGSGADGRLSSTDIDDVTPAGPALLGDFSGHAAVVNSAALRAAGIDASTPDPPGGVVVRDASGHPTGLLFEAAVGLVAGATPPITAAERFDAIRTAQADLLHRGIVSVTDPGLGPGGTTLMDGTGTLDAVAAYLSLDDAGDLHIRTHIMLLFGGLGGTTAAMVAEGLDAWGPPRRAPRHQRVSIDQLKVFADGIPRSRTSWLSEPYDDCTHGHMTVAGENDAERVAELHAIVQAGASRGWQVGTHATGDATITAFIDSVTALTSGQDLRHYVIHGDLVQRSDLPRLHALTMAVNTQPGIRWAVASAASQFLGRERNLGKQPLRSMIDAGVVLALSTDAPVIEPDWRRTLVSAVTRNLRDEPDYTDAEAITVDQALDAMTHAGAWQCHEEGWRGRIAPGMAADLVVLDRAVDWTDPDDILAIGVDSVLIDGRVACGELGRLA